MPRRMPQDSELLELIARADADGKIGELVAFLADSDAARNWSASEQRKAQATFLRHYDPRKILEFVRVYEKDPTKARTSGNIVLQSLKLWFEVAANPETPAGNRMQAQAKIQELTKSCAAIHPFVVKNLKLDESEKRAKESGVKSPYVTSMGLAQGA